MKNKLNVAYSMEYTIKTKSKCKNDDLLYFGSFILHANNKELRHHSKFWNRLFMFKLYFLIFGFFERRGTVSNLSFILEHRNPARIT
jgi:hypothetical protein